tara:strand:- start:578 stop:841 length:264 start_codon:yes stop_codon:yes gene_type:complete
MRGKAANRANAANSPFVRILVVHPVRSERPEFLEQPFRLRAANSLEEPDPVIVILCCARTQHEECGTSERTFAAAQRDKRSFMQSAA